jgi:GNAT superfamily N-acetyltransferase
MITGTLRPAQQGDLDALLALQRTYYVEDGYSFVESEAREALATLLSDPELGRVWLIETDTGAVGYLVVTLGYSLEYRGRDAFVDELFVLSSQRGRGLGTTALTVAEEACRELGVRALHLEVERDRVAAQATYRRWGFSDHRRYLMTKLLV